jgi:4'-phosphopantetheinyl transferase
VAVADLRLPAQRLVGLVGHLSPPERLRADAFHRRIDRERYIAARGLLRELLATQLGLPAKEVPLAPDPRGKPALDPTAGLVDLRFNASRSSQRALFAWAIGREVGVDVERVRDLDLESVAQRALSGTELRDWRARPQAERGPAFFAVWARKEAYVKGRGRGLAMGVERVQPRPTRQANRHLVPDPDGEQPPWTVLDIEVPGGYAGAVAAEGEEWALLVPPAPGAPAGRG